MSLQSDGAGSIYDLGYRRYDGVRLGRRHSVLSLYFYTLRGAFGLGRRSTKFQLVDAKPRKNNYLIFGLFGKKINLEFRFGY